VQLTFEPSSNSTLTVSAETLKVMRKAHIRDNFIDELSEELGKRLLDGFDRVSN
jgi:hypothetical protein